MKSVVGMLCACLPLVVVAGCGWNLGNTRVEADVRIDEKPVDVALDDAAARIQGELQKRGLEVTVTPSGDTARVVSKTRSGDQFTLVLRREKTAAGKERTRVRVEWGTRPDRELWLALLLVLGA
jgi:hypothetical protein